MQCPKIFALVVEDYPDTDRRLSETAPIVANPSFESAIVKIQGNNCTSMTVEEIASVESLRVTITPAYVPAETEAPSLAERALKRRKTTDLMFSYVDTRFLFPTSNVCERSFSSAKFALDDRRTRMTPQNFEAQMFLHSNRALWGAVDVQKAML